MSDGPTPQKRYAQGMRPARRTGGLLLLACCFAAAITGQDSPKISASEKALYRGEPARAAEFAEKYIREHPQEAAGHVQLAQAKLAQGDYGAAYRELREGLRIDPESVDALYHLTKLSLILSQVEYQKLFAMAPDSHRVHQLMAEANLAQRKYVEAAQEYRKALQANPESVVVLNALGDLRRTRSELSEPKEALAGRFREAALYYQRALKVDPLSYDAHYGLAVCRLELADLVHPKLQGNEMKQAERHFRQAVSADSRSAVARLGLGRALLAAGRSEAAVKELMRAAELEPRLRQAYFLLGRAYQRLGRREEAKEAFERERLLRAEFEADQRLLLREDFPGLGLEGEESPR